MIEDTLELMRRTFEENSKQPYVLESEDGASIAVLLCSPAVPHGCRTAFFHVNEAGEMDLIDASVYVEHGVTDPEPSLYEALNAVNFNLMTYTGVRAYLDLYEADIMLECRSLAPPSDDDTAKVCMTMLHELEMALDVCGRYPVIFSCSNEANPFGTGGVKPGLADIQGMKRFPSRSELYRSLRRTYEEHEGIRAVMKAAHRKRLERFAEMIANLPDIDQTQKIPPEE